MALPIEIDDEEYPVVPYASRHTSKIICVGDTETDPFSPGRIPKPFTVGFYDGTDYVDFWGDDCVDQFFEYLKARKANGDELLVYFHNGGNFDFHFFLEHMDKGQVPLLIGGRITKAFFGGIEFRDSYKILPSALSAYKKDEIDYSWFERETRERHRTLILTYQKSDCVYTHELVSAFHNTYGDRITIGQAAIDSLTATVGYAKLSQYEDRVYRNWFFGGRTQAFEKGILFPSKGKRWKVIDVHSMYPNAMARFKHPIGKEMRVDNIIDNETVFALIECSMNNGAFPRKLEDGSLDFTGGPGRYYVTKHELDAAEELGLVSIKKVHTSIHMPLQVTFEEWVFDRYKLRVAAGKRGDDAMKLIYKYELNNGFGKFAQDGERYKDWFLAELGELPPGFEDDFDDKGEVIPGDRYDRDFNPGGWRVHSKPYGSVLWRRDNRKAWRGYRNVRIAASITGAARSVLMRGLAKATRPVYCDTDSIICEDFSGELHDSELGTWGLEAEGDKIAIAGKKLYALFDGKSVVAGQTQWEPIKKASKGARLSALQIEQVARGASVTDVNMVPTFRLGEQSEFISREITRSTREIVRFGERKRRQLTVR